MNNQPIPLSSSIERPDFIEIINAGLLVNEYRFIRQSCNSWLQDYPGDLEIQFILARCLTGERLYARAVPILSKLCTFNPFDVESHKLLAFLYKQQNSQMSVEMNGCIYALGGETLPNIEIPSWAITLQKISQSIRIGNYSRAESLIHDVLQAASHTSLTAYLHLQIIKNQGEWHFLQSMAKFYHQQYPDSIAIMLVLADALMQGGEADQAVKLLHESVVKDICGVVAKYIWGANHPYKTLWPDDISIRFDIPIPASVSMFFGWNQLPSNSTVQIGEKQSGLKSLSDNTATDDNGLDTSLISEELISVQPELDKISERLNKPNLSQVDGRYPMYVVFTTRQGLLDKYGMEKTKHIHRALNDLVTHINKQKNWGALLLYADDPRSTSIYRIKPGKTKDPWSLKLVLSDLEKSLMKKGGMIGAVLIVGGTDIVPFHNLPNPTDDMDIFVPSDNPYGTRDENFFIPEWPVGRLPDESGSNPEFLIHCINQIMLSQSQQSDKIPWGKRILPKLKRLFGINSKFLQSHSFGVTAEIWQRASISVFHSIGDPKRLVTSPPINADKINRKNGNSSAKLNYYNLHGIPDSPEWFGQKDPVEGRPGPDYPVALRPKDVENSGKSPHVVYSEACYGANILNKQADQALSLKFLRSGTRVVVGSTCISYGSITTPLNAADLLGKAYWQYLKDGIPSGEALRRAKFELAKIMHRRQGYLDGEDQKTLISFVHYGDPLYLPVFNKHPKKTICRTLHPSEEVKTVCDRVSSPGEPIPIPPEVVKSIKSFVKQYLPGMEGANISYSHEISECTNENHQCPTSKLGSRTKPDRHPTRRVVTLAKDYPNNQTIHRHYARLTFDTNDRIAKLVVSR